MKPHLMSTARSLTEQAKVPVSARWRRRVLRAGVDVTDRSSRASALVIAPHPDDETIGCGATISRKRACGTEVDIAVVTDGRHSHRSALLSPSELGQIRMKEVADACQVLGIESSSGRLHRLGFEEGTLDRAFEPLVARLAELIQRTVPDEILVIDGRDWHPDHRLVFDATIAACERTSFGGRVLAFPVWFWMNGPWTGPPVPNRQEIGFGLITDVFQGLDTQAELVATDGHVAPKREAFKAHRSQQVNLTSEDGWQVLTPGWIDHFCGSHEAFFPVDVSKAAARAQRKQVPTVTDPVTAVNEQCRDTFVDTRLPGTVIGSRGSDGSTRLGVDAEDRISIDDRALRFGPLKTPGWGRQGIAYGPFGRRAGLSLSVLALNGHNTAQSDVLPEGRRAMGRRLIHEFPRGKPRRPHIDDNLAVGFFDAAVPSDPVSTGNAFIMHAAGVINGELRVQADGRALRVHQDVQNVPIHYVVVLRSSGAAYYVAGTPDAEGLGDHPFMRPVGIDTSDGSDVLYAGVHQAVHGETRYLMDSRIYGIHVEQLSELTAWSATALIADRLVSTDDEHGAVADVGHLDGTVAESDIASEAMWSSQRVIRADDGATLAPDASDGIALIDAGAPAGLLHATISTGPFFASAEGRVELRLRCSTDADGPGWRVVATADRVSLEIRPTPRADWTERATENRGFTSATVHHVQILDSGNRISVHIDGVLQFGDWFKDTRLGEATGAGFVLSGHASVADFEVQPRQLPIPPQLLFEPLWHRRGTTIAVEENFTGPPRSLTDTPPATLRAPASNSTEPKVPWERVLGRGRIDLDGQGSAVVRATPQSPNPDRTVFLTQWLDPEFADLEVTLTAPGTARGEGHNGRGGVAFWEDDDNYVIVSTWLDDHTEPDGSAVHDGSAISQFWMTDGHEGFYEAVWANIGRRIHWGATYRIRVASDGRNFLTWLDDEPVLFRARRDMVPRARPLRINRVGIVVNTEWGDDTGTRFERFVGRST